MKIRIYNHDENLNIPKSYTNVENMEDVLLSLLYSDGEEDKPVRIIIDEDCKAVILKFGVKHREVAILDEINNLEILSKYDELKHIAKYQFKNIFSEQNACILGIEYVSPCIINEREEIKNFRELSQTEYYLDFKHALFQILFTLLQLQSMYPGFRHNDLKADNVLLENAPKCNLIYQIESSKTKKVFRLRNCKVFTKIIDFELASTPKNTLIKSESILKSDEKLKNDFGLSIEKCDAFDVHLLLIDVLKNTKNNIEFTNFVYDFFKIEYFQHPKITVQYRLTKNTQTEIQKIFENSKRNLIYEMLSHPYFFELRDDQLQVDLDYHTKIIY